MAEPESPLFRVDFSPAILERLRAFGVRAKALGIGKEYLTVLQTMTRDLEMDPVHWGDPIYRLHHVGMTLYRRIQAFLLVIYAVDEENRLVIVSQVRIVPGHPLEQEP